MNSEELKNELKMTYEELQHYLIEKYGSAKYDYFVNPECKSKNQSLQMISCLSRACRAGLLIKMI